MDEAHLPTPVQLVRNARGELFAAREALDSADQALDLVLDWLRSDHQPVGSPFPDHLAEYKKVLRKAAADMRLGIATARRAYTDLPPDPTRTTRPPKGTDR